MTDVKVNSVITVLEFQNGKIDNKLRHKLTAELYADEESQEHVVVSSSKELLFCGETLEKSDYDYYVVDSGDNCVYPVTFAELSTKVPVSKKSRQSTNSKQNVSILNKQFGSKKAKRATETREKLKINVDLIKEQLEKTVADVTVSEEALTNSKYTASYLPPINTEAENLEDVYKVKKLVPSNVLKSLKTDNPVQFKSEFINDLSLKCTKSKHVSILIIMDSLISMVVDNAKNMSNSRYNPCPYSDAAKSFLLDNFMMRTDKGRTRPNTMKDKSICWIIVLGLAVNNYKIDLQELSKHLKTGFNKLKDVAKVLRLHLIKNDAVLQLPLPAEYNPYKKARKA